MDKALQNNLTVSCSVPVQLFRMHASSYGALDFEKNPLALVGDDCNYNDDEDDNVVSLIISQLVNGVPELWIVACSGSCTGFGS